MAVYIQVLELTPAAFVFRFLVKLMSYTTARRNDAVEGRSSFRTAEELSEATI